MNEKILLINDIPGYGKVALAAMMPILAHMKYDVYNLPTAVVSNTLDYGKFDILETTEYMKKTLKVWDELGFSFDAITTGFIVSQEQADIVTRFCREQASRGVRIFVDPIMGDEGHLYNGVGEETVERMRDLCRIADYIMPNYTEAAVWTVRTATWTKGKRGSSSMRSGPSAPARSSLPACGLMALMSCWGMTMNGIPISSCRTI